MGVIIIYIITLCLACTIIIKRKFGSFNIKRIFGSFKNSDVRQKINIAAEKEFLDNKLNVDRRILLEDDISVKKDEKKLKLFAKQILIDEKKEKIGLIDYEREILFIVNYSDINSYKIYENENQETVGIANRRGIYRGRTENISTILRLMININNKSNPLVKYDLIEKATNKNTGNYETYLESLEKACAYLDIILKEKKVAEKFIYCMYCGAKNKASDSKCVACGSRFTKK